MRLSYSFCNEIIQAPHAYLNRINQAPRVEREYWKQGKAVHEIVQKSVSGVELHPMLFRLPTFNRVEKMEQDPDMHIEFKHKGYDYHGYVDLIDDERQEFGDIKSGSTPWGLSKAKKHPQFALYSHALGMKDFVLITLPKQEELWTEHNIKVARLSFTDTDINKAFTFIDQAIWTIENIKEAVKSEDMNKSRWSCNYQNCEYCGANS